MSDLNDALPTWIKTEAVKAWQKDPRFHNLTCGTKSSHSPLIPFYKQSTKEFMLKCLDCSYTQSWVPEVVFQKYLREENVVTTKRYFKFEVFDGIMKSFPWGEIVGLGADFLRVTFETEATYFCAMGKRGENLGLINSGDYIVTEDEKFEGIYSPETFKEKFKKEG